MRIVVPIWQYQPFIGGAERKAQAIAAKLVSNGHEVTIVTGRFDADHPPREEIDGTTIIRIPERAGRLFRWTGAGRNIPTALRFAWYVWRNRRRIDVIHAFLILPVTILPGLAAAIAGIPMTVDVGSMGINSDLTKTRRLKLGSLLAHLALRLPWTVVASCTAMREDLIGEGFRPDRITVRATGIPIPIDDEIVPAGERRREIVVVGRLHPLKGQDIAIRAWSEIANDYPDWTLRLIGDGPERRALEDLARAEGIPSRVEFVGWCISPWEVAKYASICLVPSRIESTSLALLEAHAWGLPVVATDVGGSTEVIAQGGGILVPAESPSAMAGALAQLIIDPGRALLYGRRGRNYVRHVHDIDIVARDFIMLPPPRRLSLSEGR